MYCYGYILCQNTKIYIGGGLSWSYKLEVLNFRVIQSSHPVCNTIMLLGVCTCLWSVFLLGLDGQFVSPHMYPVVCQARAWLLCIGFTLAYGAMFSKVWRVHRLTTKAKSEVKVGIFVPKLM
jgi:hypothetical protein